MRGEKERDGEMERERDNDRSRESPLSLVVVNATHQHADISPNDDSQHAEFTVGRHQSMLLPRHHNEYPLIDQGRGIRNSKGPVKLTFNWYHPPHSLSPPLPSPPLPFSSSRT